MARNQVRITKDQAGQVTWQMGWRTVATLGAAFFLAVLAWNRVQVLSLAVQPVIWSGILALVALHAALAIALDRSLAYTPLKRGWRRRLAFLSSAGISTAYWASLGVLLWLLPGQSFNWLLAGASVCFSATGAFAGALLATCLDENIWENNSPPAQRIQDEVQLWHRQIVGLPPAAPLAKRIFDLSLAGLGLLLSAPVWLLSAFLVWFEDPGPVLFVKNSVGRGGWNFHQFKFRTMVHGAENNTGPILSQEGDARILWVGRLLRKTALDELPQLINILRGEMSFVGPRPQRTVLVHGYLQTIPEYAQRHQVLPGLSGLAQVAGDYYLTPRQKLRFDRIYIHYSSLGFDIQLLLLAFLITFWFRWQPKWNGRLPRRLLRMGKKFHAADDH